MIEISKKVEQLAPSGIRAFFDLVLGMKDVISLGVGGTGLCHALAYPRKGHLLSGERIYLVYLQQGDAGVAQTDRRFP